MKRVMLWTALATALLVLAAAGYFKRFEVLALLIFPFALLVQERLLATKCRHCGDPVFGANPALWPIPSLFSIKCAGCGAPLKGRFT